MEERYNSIEGLATGFKLLAVLLGAFGVLGGVLMILSGNISGGLIIAGIAIFVGMMMYAVAAGLTLLIDIARAGRETADHLALMRRRRRGNG